MVYNPGNTFNDIIYIGKITLHVPVVEHINRFTGYSCFCEKKERHIRATPWAVHGKEAQTGCCNPVQMAVGMSHKLICFFAGRIETDRVIDIMMHRERKFFVKTIDRRTRCVTEIVHSVMAAGFKNIDKPDNV